MDVVDPETTHPGQLAAAGSMGRTAGLVATVNQYRLAPGTLDHENVGVTDTSFAASEGESSVVGDSDPAPPPSDTKTATNERFAVTVNEYVGLVETWLPFSVQRVKVNPAAGVAVT